MKTTEWGGAKCVCVCVGGGGGGGGGLNQFYSRETSPLILNQLQIPNIFPVHTGVCICTKCMTCLIPIL